MQTRGEEEAVNVPAGHPAKDEKQEVDPALLLVPAGQGRQADSEKAAGVLLKVLGGHLVGDEELFVL